MDLTTRARRYLSRMDSAIAGSGGHDRTFAVASVLVHGWAFERELALSLLREWNATHCKPLWSENELQHKIDSALASTPAKPKGHLIGEGVNKGTPAPPSVGHHAAPAESVSAWPSRNHGKILDLLSRAFQSLDDLEKYSPIPLDDLKDPYALIDNLFSRGPNPDPLLCLARDIKKPATRKRSLWQGHIERAQFIVPNTMSKRKGKTKDGRDSVRCLDNTGPRRFLVIECDFIEKEDGPLFDWLNSHGASLPDLCATVLLSLAEYAPLVMAVHSGGKSLHGWFAVKDQPENQLKEFMRYACTLGADKATWTRCQFVRLPNGTRDNGKPQTVHYFDNDSALLSY